KSAIVERRARELGITTVIQGTQDKLSGWQRGLEEQDIQPEYVAYMGDDLADLAVLKRAGLAGAVAGSCPGARRPSHYVTKLPGGRGAVREVIEILLRAQERWPDVIARLC